MATQRQPQQFAPVRIVFRMGNKFVCGMCRKSHRSQKEAKSCLRDDLERMVNTQPVRLVKHGEELAFRCRLCSRDYERQEQAFTCARECKFEIDKKRVLEEKITGIPLPAPKPKSFTKQEPIAIPIQQVAKVPARRPDNPTPQPPPDLPSDTEKDPATIDELTGVEPSTQEPSVEEVNTVDESADHATETSQNAALNTEKDDKAPKRRTTDVKEKFYRADAKYVCSVCSEKYFTKIEVEQCFERHVIEEQSA